MFLVAASTSLTSLPIEGTARAARPILLPASERKSRRLVSMFIGTTPLTVSLGITWSTESKQCNDDHSYQHGWHPHPYFLTVEYPKRVTAIRFCCCASSASETTTLWKVFVGSVPA